MHWREYQFLQKAQPLGPRFLSYVDEGAGAPVVLLHGFPTWGYLWHGLLGDLSMSFRVLIPDLPGYGFSDKSDRFDRGIDRQTEFIINWLDQLKIEKASFVGQDIGGGIALRLACLYPNRVSRLALLNPVCYDGWPHAHVRRLGKAGLFKRLMPGAFKLKLEDLLKEQLSNQPDDGLIPGLVAPYLTDVSELSLMRAATSLNTNHTIELNSFLPLLRQQTAIILGENDELSDPRYAVQLARDIAGTQLVRLPAKRLVMWDQAKATSDTLMEFLGGTALTAAHAA